MNTPSKLIPITKRSFREGYPSYDLLGDVSGTVIDAIHTVEENIAKGINPNEFRTSSTGKYEIGNQGECIIRTCYEVTIDGVTEPVTLRMLETRVNHDLANRSNATGISYSTIVYIKKTQQERTQR